VVRVLVDLRAVVVIVRMLVRVTMGMLAVFMVRGVMLPVPVTVVVVVVAAVMMPVLILRVRVRRAFVDAKFHTLDLLPLLAVEVHVKITEVELRQLPFEGGGFHAEIDEGADGHVAADPGEAIEEECFHFRCWVSKFYLGAPGGLVSFAAWKFPAG